MSSATPPVPEDSEQPFEESAAASTATASQPQPTTTSVAPYKRKRGRPTSPPVDPVFLASLRQGGVIATQHNLHGLAGLLGTAHNKNRFPSLEQVQAAAHKAVQGDQQPPWIHWSKADMAQQPQAFRVKKLALQGNLLKGYRMARASHGVSRGTYYFEVWVEAGPTAQEIMRQLPNHARLGPGLRKELEEALLVSNEENEKKRSSDDESGTEPDSRVGGHLRVGWSMRTGDLQAGVGYDKWSYGIRSKLGSIVHKSQRQDEWGGEGFGEGDVVGCCISLDPEDEQNNHIRFFKNGRGLGQFELRKGKRYGGEAFTEIAPGTYYPAVSSYLGGACKANFGPKFVYPPKKLPPGFTISPLTDLYEAPNIETIKSQASKIFRTAEDLRTYMEAVNAEVGVLKESYDQFMKEHLENIRKMREERDLNTDDL